MESEEIKKVCANDPNDALDLPPKICRSACRICSSDYLKEIHLLRKNGVDLKTIASTIKKKSGGRLDIHFSSYSRHFQNYNEIKATASAKIIKHDLIDEATKRAAHSSAVVKLIDKYIELLEERFNAGLVKVNISDMQKLFDIRYKILEGGEDGDKDLLAVFQKSVDKYGLETSQGVLFGRPSSVVRRANEPQDVENSQERKEAERAEA